MKQQWTLPMIALAALVAGSAPALAQSQNNMPSDPTAPGGGACTGFPGDPASCPRQDEQPGVNQPSTNQPGSTIPEDPNGNFNTNSGQPPSQTTPDENNQQQLPNGDSPDNGTSAPSQSLP